MAAPLDDVLTGGLEEVGTDAFSCTINEGMLSDRLFIRAYDSAVSGFFFELPPAEPEVLGLSLVSTM